MDQIRFETGKVIVTTAEGQIVSISLEKLISVLAPECMNTCGVVLPDGIRLIYPNGPMTVVVYERPPGPTPLKWIAADSPAPYGEEATYRQVTISLPYVVVLAAFENNTLSDYSECFFRVDRIREEDDDHGLLYPGLLNCSRFMPPEGRPLSWICTQKLDRSAIRHERNPKRRIRLGLEALNECLFETGFNYSSDHHERSSWYTESKSVDKRIATIDSWQEETCKDGFFAMEVPWLDTGMTVKQVVQRMFENRRLNERKISTSKQLARLILKHSGT